MILNPSPLVADASSARPPFHPTQSPPGALPPVTSVPLPPTGSEYLLVCEAHSQSLAEGTWRFTLEQSDGTPVFDAEDTDLGDLNRLTLLAAVRGLESIEGPSNVTLLSNNRYLIRSLSDSLPRWRQNDFVWEHFGRRIDVQHADLWRRIDRALSIHRVEAVLISARLVSRGIGQSPAKADSTDAQYRIDSPHQQIRRPKSRRRSRSSTSAPPPDQLRQWLIGNSDSDPGATARTRFTTAELLQTS